MVPSVVVAAGTAATEAPVVAAAEVVAAATVAGSADGRGAEAGDDGDGGARRGAGTGVAARVFTCCRRREWGWLPVEVAVSEAHRHPSVGCIAAVHCPPGGVVGLLNLGGGSLRLVYQQVTSCDNLAVGEGAQPIGYRAVQVGQVGKNLLSCVLDG